MMAAPKKKTRRCPRCLLKYTQNSDGRLRKHPEAFSDDVCSQLPKKPTKGQASSE